MKVCIINTFHVFDHRVSMVNKYFKSADYDVEIITSDFNHDSKSTFVSRNKDMTLIKTIPYMRNISFRRIVSHITFARKAARKASEEMPDLIYVVLPPNALAGNVVRIKKKYPNTKVIFDIMDLWPESFPVSRFKNNLFFRQWRLLRNRYLIKSDYIILECDYYSRVLRDVLPESRYGTIHMPIEQGYYEEHKLVQIDELNICYLGSINNIIDIELIYRILHSIATFKRVNFIIIGDGENKNNLIKLFDTSNVKIIDHGIIYDSKSKFDILSKCHFGLNIMKETVEVGLTMKSLEYFRVGTPIINNIKGDSNQFVSTYNCGFNITSDLSELINLIKKMTIGDYNNMKYNSRRVYEEFLSDETFLSMLDNVIKKMR